MFWASREAKEGDEKEEKWQISIWITFAGLTCITFSETVKAQQLNLIFHFLSGLSLEGSAERNLLASMTTMLNRFRIEVYFSEIIIVVSCCCGSCGWLRMNLMSSSEWARARFLKTFDHFLKMKNSQNNGKYGKYLKRGWIFVEKYLRFPVQFSTWRRVENLFTKS